MSSCYRSNWLGLSHWDPYAVCRGGCLELYYYNMVEWFWWDSSPISTTNWFPSVLWHCWFVKIVPKMTCNVLSGKLSLYTTTTTTTNTLKAHSDGWLMQFEQIDLVNNCQMWSLLLLVAHSVAVSNLRPLLVYSAHANGCCPYVPVCDVLLELHVSIKTSQLAHQTFEALLSVCVFAVLREFLTLCGLVVVQTCILWRCKLCCSISLIY